MKLEIEVDDPIEFHKALNNAIAALAHIKGYTFFGLTDNMPSIFYEFMVKNNLSTEEYDKLLLNRIEILKEVYFDLDKKISLENN